MQRTKREDATVAMTLIGALALAMLTTGLAAADHRGDDTQRKSKNGKAEGAIGGVQVTVEYGRPNVGGRKIWGALVPYGQVWRAGADEATTIAFDRDVEIEGRALAAGRYSLFLVPSEDDWTVVFNTVDKQWGAYKYEDAKDALRVTVKPRASAKVEALEYALTADGVEMRWDELAVPFKVGPAG